MFEFCNHLREIVEFYRLSLLQCIETPFEICWKTIAVHLTVISDDNFINLDDTE